MLSSIFSGIFFLVLGLFLFLKPGLVWKLTEQWKSYRADEPSDLFLLSTKFGGILFALLGLAMIVLPLFLE